MKCYVFLLHQGPDFVERNREFKECLQRVLFVGVAQRICEMHEIENGLILSYRISKNTYILCFLLGKQPIHGSPIVPGMVAKNVVFRTIQRGGVCETKPRGPHKGVEMALERQGKWEILGVAITVQDVCYGTSTSFMSLEEEDMFDRLTFSLRGVPQCVIGRSPCRVRSSCVVRLWLCCCFVTRFGDYVEQRCLLESLII